MSTEIVTLQQANRRTNTNVRIFCADAIHLQQMSQGLTECEHCKKVLPRISIAKCEHGVYRPAYGSGCSLCSTQLVPSTEASSEIKALASTEPNLAHNRSVLINSADQVLKGISRREKSTLDAELQYDRNAFDNRQDPAIPELCEQFDYNKDDDDGAGFYLGMLRGTKTLEIRNNAPHWIANESLLADFVNSQPNPERASAVLYDYFKCGATDKAIAHELESTEDAVKKYRSRLLAEGNARYGTDEKKAA